jgi:hypothetical protein
MDGGCSPRRRYSSIYQRDQLYQLDAGAAGAAGAAGKDGALGAGILMVVLLDEPEL